MDSPLTIAAFLVYARIQIARSCGIDVKTVLQRVGLKERIFLQPLARLTLEQDNAIWRELVAMTDDDNLGFKLGRYFRLQGFGVIGYMMMNTRTIGDGLKLFCRYEPLLTNMYRTEFDQDRDHLIFIERYVGEWQPERRHTIDFMASSCAAMVADMGDRRTVPTLARIAFPYPQPLDLDPYYATFGAVNFSFGHPELRVQFDGGVEDVPVVGASPAMLAAFEQQADALMTRYEEEHLYDSLEGELCQQVRQQILQYLRRDTPTLNDIASQLTMSARSLQLKLKAEGTSFKVLLDEVRRDLAIEYLQAGKLNKSEIACLLGFSEVSAFSRVFKRWTGQSPSEFQRTVRE